MMMSALANLGCNRQQLTRRYSLPWQLLSSVLSLLLLILTTINVEAVDISNCKKSLGMQSGAIPDNAISASSSYDSASVGPSNARIRTERFGGAWCPKPQIAKNIYEWIQIDLGELKVVTQVETQGRFGNGQGQEFAEAYMLEYQRTDSGRWIRFRDRKGNEVFLGNGNTYIAELREINPPIIARRIRVIPYSNHPRTVCMRLELYGCVWKDGILSYSMPQGDRRGSEVDLYDYTYDGEIRTADQYLFGGLGQLTDGAEGHSNFRLDPEGWGRKGYEWVGWKNDTSDRLSSEVEDSEPESPPISGSSASAAAAAAAAAAPTAHRHTSFIEIIFEFNRVRNFSAVRFHANNMFLRDVRVFRRAALYFSVGGTVYQPQPVVFDYMRDTLIELARNVIVPVPNRIGRFIRVELYFDAKWIMISEVRFDSDPVTGNYTEELLPPGYRSTSSGSIVDPRSTSLNGSSGSSLGGGSLTEPVGGSGSTWNPVSTTSNGVDDRFIGILAGVFGVVILLIVVVIIFCLICRRRRFSTAKKSSGACAGGAIKVPGSYLTPLSSGTGRLEDFVFGGGRKSTTNGLNAYTNATSGGGYGVGVTLLQQPFPPGNGDVYDEDDIIKMALPPTFAENGYNDVGGFNQSNDAIGNGVGQQTRRPLPEVPVLPFESAGGYLSDTNTSTYAVPEQLLSAFSFARPPVYTLPPPPPANDPSIGLTYRSQPDIDLGSTTLAGGFPVRPPSQPFGSALHLQPGGSGGRTGSGRDMEMFNLLHGVPANVDDSGVYSSLPGDPSATAVIGFDAEISNVQLTELDRDDLVFVEKLGDGQFGEMHLCETTVARQQSDEPSSRTIGSKTTLAAVKLLNNEASLKARAEYFNEAKLMACLKDPNIINLIGVCTRDDPVCFVFEFLKHGDLNQFLLNHVSSDNSLIRSNGTGPPPKALSYGCLIYMATQIASGMKYLETLNMVHRDLATRNCLVGHKYHIKISDFGVSRSIFSSDYYRVDGKALPVRWMPWESVLLGNFSTKSDVWSFAVTLWEILTFARDRPIASLSDEQIIEMCGAYYRGEETGRIQTDLFPQPACCPREIYNLMVECWNREATQRPAFREIHMFLQRKNMGYNPADERRTPSRSTTPYV